jgi:hypothetical protein
VLAAVGTLALITLVCSLAIGSAIAAGRARTSGSRRGWLGAQAALLAAVLAAGVVVSFAGGSAGKGLVAIVAFVGVAFGFVLGAGVIYVVYVLLGRRDRFSEELSGALWLGYAGPRRLDGRRRSHR